MFKIWRLDTVIENLTNTDILEAEILTSEGKKEH